LARHARWRAAHPEEVRAQQAAKRARKRNAPINDLTADQWLELQAAHDHRCAYCGQRTNGHLTQDHIQPLSKGGPHTLTNIVPACQSCNSRKNTGPPPVPVQPLLLTLAPPRKPRTM
jgi:5-methylcytosine-specific restriction endonuclease McrA